MLFFFFFKAAVSTVNSCGFEDLSACDTEYLVEYRLFLRTDFPGETRTEMPNLHHSTVELLSMIARRLAIRRVEQHL